MFHLNRDIGPLRKGEEEQLKDINKRRGGGGGGREEKNVMGVCIFSFFPACIESNFTLEIIVARVLAVNVVGVPAFCPTSTL